jgi:putative DNA methylase
MSLIRRENKEGLRLWENEDVVPRPTDVFQERLYCIRWVIPAKSQKLDSKEQQDSLRKNSRIWKRKN